MKNFGKIKNTFNDLLSESMATKNVEKRKLFKKYIKMLSENEILKTQFNVYNSIEEMIEENQFKASTKIKMNIDLLESFDRKDIFEANDSLVKLLKGRECNDAVKGSYTNAELHESITNMIFEKDINKFVDSLNEAVEYAKGNTGRQVNESVGLPNKIFAPLLVDKYNEKYADLNESEKAIIKSILESDEKGKEELFKTVVSECLELVNERLKDAEVNLKEGLLAVKENLLSREYIKESFDKDIFKILELKEDLK
jgi:hypothetical protein